jgi:hypothetical protein
VTPTPTAVSHIPQFEDATTSPVGDAASPAEDVDVSADDALSHTGDLLASPNFRICDTTQPPCLYLSYIASYAIRKIISVKERFSSYF